MNRRVLQAVTYLLATAVTFMLVAVLVAAYLRVVRARGPVAAATTTSTTTSLAEPAATTTTASPATTTTAAPTTTLAETGDCTVDAPPGQSGLTTLRVFYNCGGAANAHDHWVYRQVPATPSVLTASITELLAGPTPDEVAAGFRSVFTTDTAGALRGLTLSAGTAVVDFTSALAAVEGLDAGTAPDRLLASLNATVFQFDTIAAVEYRLAGSCDDFFGLLGRACTTITRSEWVAGRG